MEVRTRLGELRSRRGLGAAELAAQIGVSRQTVYAIEAGTYVPNTAVSLKLARVLDVQVEELFQLQEEEEAAEELLDATILGDTDAIQPNQPVRLCDVGGRVIGLVQEASDWELAPADGILLEGVLSGELNPVRRVRALSGQWRKFGRILLAGCDPSVSMLVQSLAAQGVELLVAHRNSSQSLDLLQKGLVHVAGTHLVDRVTEEADWKVITERFGRSGVAIFSYAEWDEGFIIAPGNPKNLNGVADLCRRGVRFTNREAGSGCRRLLDELLNKEGIAPEQVQGYDRVTVGHLLAARMVRKGEVDCCISTRSVARALGLEFVPLSRKPYHLVVRKQQLKTPGVQTLIETLGRATFRRETAACTGYEMKTSGDRLL